MLKANTKTNANAANESVAVLIGANAKLNITTLMFLHKSGAKEDNPYLHSHSTYHIPRVKLKQCIHLCIRIRACVALVHSCSG